MNQQRERVPTITLRNHPPKSPTAAMALIVASTAALSALILVPCCLRRGAPQQLRHFVGRYATSAGSQQQHRMCAAPEPIIGRYVDSIDIAAKKLRAGGLVAFPTETVYGLGAHAMDADALARIFTVKGRPRTDPLIVHVASTEAAEKLVRLDDTGLVVMRKLMKAFWPGPLTLVAPACPELPPIVTAETGFVGVRWPAHARAAELLRAAGIPVAAPSANRFGHVSPTQPEHVMDDLGAHDIYVLRPDPAAAADKQGIVCDVGIESTVLKLDVPARELLLLVTNLLFLILEAASALVEVLAKILARL